MRQCDICSTIIPFGTDRCPNCGYRYKPERKLDQLQKKTNKANYMAQFQPHPSPIDTRQKNFSATDFKLDDLRGTLNRLGKKVNKKPLDNTIIGTIVGVVIIIFMAFMIVGGIGNLVEDFDFSISDNYSEEEFFIDEIQSISYGDYETFAAENEHLIFEVNDAREFIHELMMKYQGEIFYENYFVEDGELFEAWISGYIEVGENTVDVSMSRVEDDPWHLYLTTGNYVEGEIVLPEKILTVYSEILEADVDEVWKAGETFVSELGKFDAYEEYELGNGTLMFNYFDRHYFYVEAMIPYDY